MLLMLCGASCTGKDTIRKELVTHYNYENIPIYTSRPMRPTEQNGAEYQFVPIEVFKQLEDNDFFIATSSFDVAVDEIPWKYGVPKDVFKDTGTDLRVMIVNPKLLSIINSKIPSINTETYCVCYVISDKEVIKKRLKERGDDRVEIVRRMTADEEDFKDIAFDIMIPNNDEPIEKIVSDIDMYYKCWKVGK